MSDEANVSNDPSTAPAMESSEDSPMAWAEALMEKTEAELGHKNTEVTEGSAAPAKEKITVSKDQERKIFKAMDRVKNSELQIPADVEIEVMVDGKPENITLQQFINGISGEKALQKRFSLLDSEKKGVQTRLNNINTLVSDFDNLRKSGKPMEALEFFLDKAGINKQTFYEAYAQAVMPQVEQYMKLKPGERDTFVAKHQHELERQEKEVLQTKLADMQIRENHIGRIKEVQRSQGIDDGKFVELFDSLSDEITQGRITLPQGQGITPEMVGNYHKLLTRESWASAALKEFAPDKFSPQATQDLAIAVGELEKKGFQVTEKDMKDLVKYTYAVQEKKRITDVNNKMKRKSSPTVTQKVEYEHREPLPQNAPSWVKKYLK